MKQLRLELINYPFYSIFLAGNNGSNQQQLKTYNIMIIDFNNNEELTEYVTYLNEQNFELLNYLDKIENIKAITHFNNCISCTGADTAKAKYFINEVKKLALCFNNNLNNKIKLDTNDIDEYRIFTNHNKLKSLKGVDFLDIDFFRELVRTLSTLDQINLYYKCVSANKYQCIKY